MTPVASAPLAAPRTLVTYVLALEGSRSAVLAVALLPWETGSPVTGA
jgi:hypothetical protein